MRGIRTLAVAVGTVAVLAACGSGRSDDARPASGSRPAIVGAPGDGIRRIAASSDATAAEQTARFATSIDATDAENSVAVTAEGAVDLRNRNLSMRMDLAGTPGGDDARAEIRVVDDVFYMDLRGLGRDAAALAEGKRWLKLDFSGLTDVLGDASLSSESSNPVDGLQALRAVSSEVTEVGRETVRGVETTHYRATIDVANGIAGAPPEARDGMRDLLDLSGAPTIPVDVWLDDQDRVRKYTMQLDRAPGGEPGATVSVTYEFYDFGVPVDVAAPPDDEIADLGSLFEGMLDGLLGGFEGLRDELSDA